MIVEEVKVRVHDNERLEVTGVGVEPIQGTYQERSYRMCAIMARAIGRELGMSYQNTREEAVKLAAGLSRLMFTELEDTLEGKPST